MTKSIAIPARNKKKVIQEAGGVCAFCGEKDVATLEFHHIHGRDIIDPHNPDNLIYVCKNCHGKITAGTISTSDVVLQKRILKYNGNPNLAGNQSSNIINVSNSMNTGTIANVIHFHSRKKSSSKIEFPVGSIGANLQYRNYLKRLIDRYHEFAKSEKGKDYKYPVFYQALTRKFGAKWDMIPAHRFDEVCLYVKGRIGLTVLGKSRKSKGQKNCSSYSDYLDKYIKG